jgi:hypothetical protein
MGVTIDSQRPRATVVLLQDGREVSLGPVRTPPRGDLALVEDLLRLQLAVARFGWSVRLADLCPRLEELLELAGVAGQLRDAGTPNSAKSSG